ncbi:MAG: hypothetical protein IKP54_10940, partial [Bacteroidales bacterium]|nr:hypothetical protein [Bacteroidales bacterium]
MKKIITLSVIYLLVFGAFAQSTNTFEYDNLNRLTKVTYANGVEVQYTYDAVGNRLSKTVTIPAQLPTVTTNSIDYVGATTATCVGNVISDGGATVTERGVCWSTSQNPTVTDAHTSNGTGTGAFISQLSGLQPNTTYHVRAYAINSKGTAYGEEMTFTTTCAQISIIIEDSVLCEGGSMLFATIVFADAPYSDILYTWYKDNVIIANESSNQLLASETGSYKVVVSLYGCSAESAEVYVNERSAPQLQLTIPETGVFIGDTTTITAYASDFNGDDFLYSWPDGHTGSTYTFVPDQIGPFIFDVTVTNILTGCEGTASVTINVHDESSRYNCGDDLIVNGVIYTTQQYGSQCWMTRNLRNDSGSEYYSWSAASQACPNGWHLPTQGDWETLASYVDNNSGQDSNIPLFFENASGEFWMDYTMVWGDLTLAGFCNISGQTINTFYGMYDVHDAEENGVIVLTRCLRDENASVVLPTITTDTVSNITDYSAICGGNVTADGGTEVMERGVCWSSSSTPTIIVAGSGTGTFAVNLTDLNPGITYHVRAYATNSAGTAYGEEVTFTTTGCAPISIVIGDSVLCEGGSMLFATIASAVAPHSEILYTWYKDNVIIANESSNQLLASETGSYKVVVSIDSCSSESAEVYVNERSTPQLQLTVTETDIFIG